MTKTYTYAEEMLFWDLISGCNNRLSRISELADNYNLSDEEVDRQQKKLLNEVIERAIMAIEEINAHKDVEDDDGRDPLGQDDLR
jgi:hypothetical protein